MSLGCAGGAGIVVSAGGVAGVLGAIWATAEVLISNAAAKANVFMSALHRGGAGACTVSVPMDEGARCILAPPLQPVVWSKAAPRHRAHILRNVRYG